MDRFKIIERQPVSLEDIGIYLRLIHMDYSPVSDEEMAYLISEQFNVDCTANDIMYYERLHIEMEDLEKIQRMSEYNYPEYLIE